ncbi:GrpB family protein [Catenulispora pinisilvae]|uniref:GrpB family protein n=1 Tax=Catenulispora pinisilvae TaxID=2705253 RepID=UPI0018913B47|nr:GrpB family protein [Catenulispora pinisilvae]
MPHDPAWLDLGRGLVARVERALSGLPADVAHIGSTSVPGLAAKPVIDVQVGCAAGDTGRVVERLRELGFEHLGQTGGPGREYLRRRSGVPANVAVVERQGRIWTANIMFRDRLRKDPDAAARYALAKQQAAEATGMLTAYSELKAAIVAELMAEAGQRPRPGT